MIEIKNITKAAESIIKLSLENDYNIERNPVRPTDPNYVMRNGKNGWIGIYKSKITYELIALGNNPWNATVNVIIEIQIANPKSREDCEDQLSDAEKKIIDLLEANRSLNGYLGTIDGYTVDYEIMDIEQTYYQSALITINGKVRQ